mgnify:FL=1
MGKCLSSGCDGVAETQAEKNNARLAGWAEWFGDEFDQLAIGVSKVAGVDLATAALKKVAPVVLNEIEGKMITGLGLLDEIAGFHLVFRGNAP